MILDVFIPGISGFEVLKRLRQGGCTLPVIAISGNAVEKEMIHEGAQAPSWQSHFLYINLKELFKDLYPQLLKNSFRITEQREITVQQKPCP